MICRNLRQPLISESVADRYQIVHLCMEIPGWQ